MLLFGVLCVFTADSLAAPLKARPAQSFQALDHLDPFWRKKKVWEEMKKERRIPVSVLRKKENWQFKGAGIVKASRAFTFEKAKEFNRLPVLPEYFKEVRFDSSKSVLHLKLLFLKKELNVDLALFEKIEEHESRLYFRSLGPSLVGLEGVLLVKDFERHACEVGILSLYGGEFDWVPDWAFAVGAEAVMHHVAEQLRKSVENDYK